jgi:hypothetical protein
MARVATTAWRALRRRHGARCDDGMARAATTAWRALF